MFTREIEEADYNQVAAIYQQGIDTGIATFETMVPGWSAWNSAHLEKCRIAAFEGSTMLGWAALSPVSGRCIYAGVAEVSVYVAFYYRGKGFGKILLNKLVTASEDAGLWTLQAGIFKENQFSTRLHEQCGFRIVGYREKIGKKAGVWWDTILMERRSKLVGV